MKKNNRRRFLLASGAIGLLCALMVLTSVDAARAVASAMSVMPVSLQAPERAGVTTSWPTVWGLIDPLEPTLQETTMLTATKRDELIVDADGSGAPGPGDTLQYTIVVTNGGTVDALNMLITDTLDANTALLGAVHVTPIAGDDFYDVLGNTSITINETVGVLGNDLDPDNGAIAANPVAGGVTVQGGAISLNADGSFSYEPPAGFSGSDAFEYIIEDNEGLAARGTINFTVGDVIWYVDDGAAAGGDGRLSAPFNAVSEAQTASSAGDIIFLYEGGYSDSLALANDQQLIGQGVGLASGAGLAIPTGTVLPSATVSPTLTGAVTLGQQNTIRGLTIANTGTTALAGSGFGTLAVSQVSIEATGRALSLENGVLDTAFDVVTSLSSSNEGISLSGVSGSLVVGAGQIEGAANAGLQLSGSTASVTYGGTIVAESAGAYAVRMFDNSGGVITLEGAITSNGGSGRGISLTGNGGVTVNLEGTITLNTGANTAFIASGGGTVSANGTGNTLVTSGAPALTIENTTIGSSGVTFESISAANSAKGIVLNNAGGGGFTVHGVASGDGSGGTLQNIAARAIEVINTDNVSFANLTLNNANTADAGGAGICDALNTSSCNAAIYLRTVTNANFDNVDVGGTVEEQGINGIDVFGFTLQDSTLSGCGNAAGEGCIKMRELWGTVAISNSSLAAAAEKVVEIHNSSGALTLSVAQSTFSDTQSSSIGADGLEIVTNGTAQASVTVSDSLFLRNRTTGLQVNVLGGSTVDLNVTGSTFDAEGASGKGVELAVTDGSELTFDLLNSPRIHSFGGNAITVAAFDSSFVEGRINNNGDIQAGGAGTSGNGIFVQANDNAGGRVEIQGNTISNIGFDDGIYVTARPDLVPGATGRLDVIIAQNSISIDAAGLYDIELQAQEANTICGAVSNNTASGNGSAAFRVREALNGTVLLANFNTDAAGTWSSNGNSGLPVSESPIGGASSGVCEAPSHALAPAESDALAHLQPESREVDSSQAIDSATGTAQEPAVMAARPQPSWAAMARLAAAPPQQVGADVEVGPFTLPAGKVVTITYQVTIADPFPASAPLVQNQARASGSNFTALFSDDPDTAQPADPTVTALDAAPDLILSKDDGGITAQPGTLVSYSLTYDNGGNQHAAGVVITETVPTYATFDAAASSVGWSCPDGSAAGTACTLSIGAVQAGAAQGSRTFSVRVLDPLPAGADQMENMAVIGDDGVGGSDAQPADNEAADSTALAAQPDLRLTKDDGGVSAAPGAVITYTLVYSNVGNQGATGVTIQETVPAQTTFDAARSSAGWSCADGSGASTPCAFTVGGLAGDDAGAVEFVVAVNGAVPAGVTHIGNSANIVDDGNNGADANGTDNGQSTTTVLEAAPVLALEKDDGGASPGSGGTLVYALTVANSGDQGALGIVLTDTVPVNTSFEAGSSDAGWSCTPSGDAGSVCTLAIDDELSSGEDVSVPFAVTIANVLPAGVTQVQNQAQAGGGGAAMVSSDDPNTTAEMDATVTELDVQADLFISKDDGQTTVVAGEALTYTITAGNLGPNAVSGAVVGDILPVELLAASWACAAGPGASCGASAGSGDIDETVNLDVDSVLTYTVNVMVDPGASGTLNNSASITAPAGVSDPIAGNNMDADDDTAISAQVDLALAMSESADPVLAGSGAGNLRYVLVLRNGGPSRATDVTVQNTTTLPAGVTVDAVDFDNASGSFAGDTWTVNELAPGASETLTVTLTVAGTAAPGEDVVSNRAVVTGAGQTIVNSGDDDVTEWTSIARGVDVRVSASESAPVVTAGSGTGNLTMVITATNDGPSAASGVVLSNTLALPAGVSIDSVTPSGGTTWQDESDSWHVGDLPTGSSATLTVALTVGAAALPGSDVVVNEATLAVVNETDGDSDNDSAVATSSVETAADLAVSMRDDRDPAVAGTAITYTVTITNRGPSDARGVQATTTLPGELALLYSNGCSEDPLGAPLCSVGVIEAGTAISFTSVVQLDAAATGTVQSSVSVSSETAESGAGDESDTESTSVEAEADVAVTVSAQPVVALAGQAFTYTVVITNAGPSRATGVAVSATLPAAFSYDDDSCGGSSTGVAWNWPAGALDAGGSAECEISGAIDDGFGGPISNTATIVSDTPDAATDNNSHTHETTVYDNRFAIGDVVAQEGDGGVTPFSFTITRTSNVASSSVDVTTVEGTASGDRDFTELTTTVSFGAGGSLTQTVTVNVVGEAVVELDETFSVLLSNPVNGGIEDDQGVATIMNDDSATVTIAGVEQVEGDEGTSNFVFGLTLSAAVDAGVSVAYATADGTAEDENGDGDYAATDGTVAFAGAAGEQQTVVVQVNGDTVMEEDEAFLLALADLEAAGRDVTLDGNQAPGTINNDDVALVDFSSANLVQGEGDGAATISVTLSLPAAYTVTVDYASSDGSASADTDYTAISGTLRFAPGETALSMMLPVLDDEVDEDDETVVLRLTNLSAGTLGAQNNPATLAIVDDDGEPTVGFSAFEFETAESAPSAVISVTLSHVSGRDVSVDVASSDQTAVAGEDYSSVAERVTIPAGRRTVTVTVGILDDDEDEVDETVTLTLSGATNATVGAVNPATLIIVDNDASAPPGYIYYFPLTVKQASMPSSGDDDTSTRSGAGGAVAVVDRRSRIAAGQGYGGTITH